MNHVVCLLPLLCAVAAGSLVLYEVPAPQFQIRCNVTESQCAIVAPDEIGEVVLKPVNVSLVDLLQHVRRYRASLEDLHACRTDRDKFRLALLHGEFVAQTGALWNLLEWPGQRPTSADIEAVVTGIDKRCQIERRVALGDRCLDEIVHPPPPAPLAETPPPVAAAGIPVQVFGTALAVFLGLAALYAWRRRNDRSLPVRTTTTTAVIEPAAAVGATATGA
jgi:hypothetical protein